MTLIKIIRSSIKRNPEAGRTSSVFPGTKEAKFECFGKIPDALRSKVEVIEEKLDGSYFAGIFPDPDDALEILKTGYRNLNLAGATLEITIDNNLVFLDHVPLSKYLYEYKNPTLSCEICGSGTKLRDIDFDYTDEGDRFSRCGTCFSFNSFGEIEFEDIEDIEDLVKKINFDIPTPVKHKK